ncbi:DEAD/DEAH box helicase [Ramlibacter sp. MAHUQ-53]|uniref:DEAD/DEAH box helicase n=1 Tax=unclassified Ramlibacter TaxID=2617605 RepID=UPI003631B36B
MSFDSLGLSPALVQAGAKLGFAEPTPIQAQAIPAVLRGADLLGLAQTGSGKTGAFALPVLERLLARPAEGRRRVRALVLVPTRELAAQVGEVFRSLSRDAARPPKVAVLFGGVSVNPQMMGLRGGADVVVATPGRLLDLLDRNALRLSDVEVLVLDEADRLLDLGFAEELARVLALLPARRQNLFFSATFPPAVQALAEPLLRDPVRVELTAADAPVPAIVQRAIQVDAARRTALLKHLVQEGGWDRVLVFVATRHAAEHVALKLYNAGLYATPLHGDLTQGQRNEVLRQFRDGGFDIVVTTDLAARGIDIPELPVVVNYDLPRSPTDYTHRIGRTGRAGASGQAISFVSAATEAHFRLIEKRQGLVLPREQVPGFEPTDPSPAEAAPAPGQAPGKLPPGTGGIKGKRPSKKDKLRAAAAGKGGS